MFHIVCTHVREHYTLKKMQEYLCYSLDFSQPELFCSWQQWSSGAKEDYR